MRKPSDAATPSRKTWESGSNPAEAPPNLAYADQAAVDASPPKTAGKLSKALDQTPGAAAKLATPIEVVRQRALDARDDTYYQKCYTACLAMAGDTDANESLKGGTFIKGDSGEDMEEYPVSIGDFGPVGETNHLLICSRINIQAIAYSDPEWDFKTDNVDAKMINAAYMREMWEHGDWGEVFYEVGMDVEAMGVGFCEFGVDDGYAVAVRRSPLDVLWDPLYRSPGDWRYFFARSRIDVATAAEKYNVSENELQELASGEWKVRGTSTAAENRAKFLYEWSYWDATSHYVFLGAIAEGKGIVVSYDDSLEYVKGGTGVNPFGIIPICVWVDSWSPGVWRPVGKPESSWRVSSMLNTIEEYIKLVLERGVPLTLLSTVGLDEDTLKLVKEASGPAAIEKVILVDTPDAAKAIIRIPGAEVPMTAMNARGILKDELNGATGVMDSQKGQPLTGDPTATEVRTLSEAQGVQAKHTRKQFAKFLGQIARVVRKIGAEYQSQPLQLALEDGTVVDTGVIDVTAFLRQPLKCVVNEGSLYYVPDQEQQRRRLMQFQVVDMPAMQAQVASPIKVFTDVYHKLGVRDVSRLLYTQQEAQSMADASAQDASQMGQALAMGQDESAPPMSGPVSQGPQNARPGVDTGRVSQIQSRNGASAPRQGK